MASEGVDRAGGGVEELSYGDIAFASAGVGGLEQPLEELAATCGHFVRLLGLAHLQSVGDGSSNQTRSKQR